MNKQTQKELNYLFNGKGLTDAFHKAAREAIDYFWTLEGAKSLFVSENKG